MDTEKKLIAFKRSEKNDRPLPGLTFFYVVFAHKVFK